MKSFEEFMSEAENAPWEAHIEPSGRGFYIRYTKGLSDISGPWRSHAWTRNAAERKARRALGHLEREGARRRQAWTVSSSGTA